MKNCTQCKGFQIDYWSTINQSLTDKSSIHISSSKYNIFSDNAWLRNLILFDFISWVDNVIWLTKVVSKADISSVGSLSADWWTFSWDQGVTNSKHQPWKHFMGPFYIINSVVKPNFLVMPSIDAAPQFLYKLTPFVH